MLNKEKARTKVKILKLAYVNFLIL